MQDLTLLLCEAEVIWSKEIRKNTAALRQCVREFRAAIEAVIDDTATGGENFKANREFGKEMRGMVSTTSGSDNTLTRSIETVIEGIESVVRWHLKRG